MSTSVLERFKQYYDATKEQVLTLEDYLELCKSDNLAYATASERMLHVIGEPTLVDTSKNQRLSRLFGNKVIKTYAPFTDFFGMEETIESLVNYFRHASQGLEESRQLLYLLGPVGGGKSSLVERIKELMQRCPIYVLAYSDPKTDRIIMSPYFSRPLSLFNTPDLKKAVSDEYGIEPRYLKSILGPWETKRLLEFNGDISKFKVVKVHPSTLKQIAITNTEPGDENTQDISTLVGKVDIRKLEDYSQNDPDAYLYSGGLNVSNQGVLDFREMFKAKIKMLNPLLFAVQEHTYNGTENFGAFPYDGMVVAHSNEAEWKKFSSNKDNEAFLDRIYIVRVPYCLRVTEEMKIYQKALSGSDMEKAPIAPGTLDFLAQFAVMTRIREEDNTTHFSKMQVYDGKNMKEEDPRAKTYLDYKEVLSNREEGFTGISTRWAFKRLSQCFNADPTEIAANPVHLRRIIIDELERMNLSEEQEKLWKTYVTDVLTSKYLDFLTKEIQTAYLESYSEFGQNLFNRYVMWADRWVSEEDFFDKETGTSMDREALNTELEKIEKAADIGNPKDFRNEVVRYVFRYSHEHDGKMPDWRSYEKLKQVIEKSMFTKTADLLPVISFAPKGTEEEKKKHSEFVQRMIEKGYTEKQTKILVDWYLKTRKQT